jgi:zinc protease
MKNLVMVLLTLLSGVSSVYGSTDATTTSILAAAADIKLPVPQIETLPNGLQLVWFLSDDLPVIDLALLIKSGYRDDPQGKTGVTELLSAALDRGAAGLSAEEVAKQVEQLGASRYISGEEETFSLGMHGLAPDADKLLDILSKIALQPDFKPAEVDREKARLLDRWNHVGDYGDALASLAYRRALTSGTSYVRGNFYSVAEFKRVGLPDVLAYYKKNFTPKNSVLMIVGRVDQKSYREKIVKLFGDWKGEAPKHQYRNTTDPHVAHAPGQILIVDRKGLTQAQVRMGFRAPLLQVPEHYALTVSNALLGEYFNSRLNALIRDKLGLTYGINSSFSYSRDFGSQTISSATRNQSVGELVRKSLDVLKDLKKGPIPDEEVDMAKEYLIGGFPLSTSTLGAVASRWMAGYIFDLGPGYLNEFVPKITKVTAQDVLAAVKKDYDLDHMVIVIAGDSKEIESSLKESGFKSYRKITIKDLM